MSRWGKYGPNPAGFSWPLETWSALRESIQCSLTRKAPGIDKITTEMLKTDIDISTELMYEVWAACGRCKRIPVEWNKAIFLPKHKKGPHADPRKYRPISLQIHARKVVVSTSDLLLRKSFFKDPMQLGFTEVAILRAEELQNRGQGWIAALDLTAADDSVPRGH